MVIHSLSSFSIELLSDEHCCIDVVITRRTSGATVDGEIDTFFDAKTVMNKFWVDDLLKAMSSILAPLVNQRKTSLIDASLVEHCFHLSFTFAFRGELVIQHDSDAAPSLPAQTATGAAASSNPTASGGNGSPDQETMKTWTEVRAFLVNTVFEHHQGLMAQPTGRPFTVLDELGPHLGSGGDRDDAMGRDDADDGVPAGLRVFLDDVDFALTSYKLGKANNATLPLRFHPLYQSVVHELSAILHDTTAQGSQDSPPASPSSKDVAALLEKAEPVLRKLFPEGWFEFTASLFGHMWGRRKQNIAMADDEIINCTAGIYETRAAAEYGCRLSSEYVLEMLQTSKFITQRDCELIRVAPAVVLLDSSVHRARWCSVWQRIIAESSANQSSAHLFEEAMNKLLQDAHADTATDSPAKRRRLLVKQSSDSRPAGSVPQTPAVPLPIPPTPVTVAAGTPALLTAPIPETPAPRTMTPMPATPAPGTPAPGTMTTTAAQQDPAAPATPAPGTTVAPADPSLSGQSHMTLAQIRSATGRHAVTGFMKSLEAFLFNKFLATSKPSMIKKEEGTVPPEVLCMPDRGLSHVKKDQCHSIL